MNRERINHYIWKVNKDTINTVLGSWKRNKKKRKERKIPTNTQYICIKINKYIDKWMKLQIHTLHAHFSNTYPLTLGYSGSGIGHYAMHSTRGCHHNVMHAALAADVLTIGHLKGKNEKHLKVLGCCPSMPRPKHSTKN